MTVNLPVAGKLRLDEWGIPLTQQCNDHDALITNASVLLDSARVTAVNNYSSTATDPQEHVKIRSASIDVVAGRAYRFCGQMLASAVDGWQLEVRKGSTSGTIVGGGQIDVNNVWTYDFIWPCTLDETTQFFYVLNRSSGSAVITLWGFYQSIWQTQAHIFEVGSATLVRDVP